MVLKQCKETCITIISDDSSDVINVYIMRDIRILLIQSLCLIFFSANASAGVSVFDDVVTVNKTIKLKAVTKGIFFSEGGKLVTFYLGEKKIGTTLSGGDGYAFLKHTPSAPGIISLKVESGKETDEGVLLVVGREEKVIAVEIESALFESILTLKPSKEGEEAMHRLSKKFRIIYLTTVLGVKQSRKLLKKNDFQLSTVLKWEGADMLAELYDGGIRIYAVIGSPDLLSGVSDIKKKFSFEETEDGVTVRDWDDLSDRLFKENKR